MASSPARWVCCQLGAREHYAVPRALKRQGRLAHLLADAWVPPGSLLQALPGDRSKRLKERYHEELAGEAVTDFTRSLVARELWWNASDQSGWDLFIARNQWFQASAAHELAGLTIEGERFVIAHSYAALDIFRAAKPRGWKCVLAQIDPGERHFVIVKHAAIQALAYGPPPLPPPPRYLDDWREECRLADHIIVNSEWSRACLEEARVPAAKLKVAPLAYEPDVVDAVPHQYPERFTHDRPLRLLFVGSASIAKGIKALLDATVLLSDVPITLSVVGEQAAQIPRQFLDEPRLRWVGAVPRSEVMHYYRDADVLVFPSLSDGFGMAQVEAQGWKLPIIASRSCGRVVKDGINGLLLPEVTPAAIAAAVRKVVDAPAMLARFSRASGISPNQGLDALGRALVSLEAA
jgi:glycosyltransferase involved in cell wall biosynthesis